MARVDLNDLASLGVIKDSRAFMLPPEALTLGENVRFVDNAIERLQGWQEVFNDPPVAPHFLMPIVSASQLFWLYVSLNKAYVWDGTDHTDITRAVGGDYAANFTRDWNGTILGGIPILNNGIDIPQFWSDYDPGDKLANVTDWPPTLRAKIVRAFGPFLIGYNIIDDGAQFPHRVRWSHPADPGSLPISWDITDPARDAGEVDLADAGGLILDALPLGGDMFIYKETSIWRQRLIGGQAIFEFKSFIDTTGALAPRCVGITGDGQRHFLATQDNLAVHNGNTLVPLLSKRMRRELFNNIDTMNYMNSFVFCNPLFDEMWFCYPEQGAVNPTRALIWNYGHGAEGGVFSEASIDFRNADQGTLQSSTLGLWSEISSTWADMAEAWNISNRRKVILANTDAAIFQQMDSGMTRNGTPYTSTVSRDSLAVVGQRRDKTPIVDFTKRKYVPRVWPKVTGAAVDVRLGFRELENDATTWEPAQEFDPDIHRYCDFDGSGIHFAWEVSSSGDIWRMDGLIFDLEVESEY